MDLNHALPLTPADARALPEMNTRERIRRYLAENFMFSGQDSDLDDDDSFLDSGVVNSLGVLELVTFVEESFGFSVPDADIVPDNFDSVNRLQAYISHRQR